MMSATKQVLFWVAAALGILVAVACQDEKKPPLTPDGPEMTTPVGSSPEGGVDMPPPPAATAPVK